MRSDRQAKGKSPLYMHQQYDVHCFTMTNLDWNPLSKVRNAGIKALNNRGIIPHTIILIFGHGLDLDPEILKSKKGINKGINWVLTELKNAVISKRNLMPAKAVPQFDTRFLIIRQLPRPLPSEDGNLFKTNRRKFNQALEKVSKLLEMTILEANDITSAANPAVFNPQDKLTQKGLEIFWGSVDTAFQFLDEKSMTKTPVKKVTASEGCPQNFKVEIDNTAASQMKKTPEDDPEQYDQYFTRGRGQGRYFRSTRGHQQRAYGRYNGRRFFKNWRYNSKMY